jgi:hypothetical protein
MLSYFATTAQHSPGMRWSQRVERPDVILRPLRVGHRYDLKLADFVAEKNGLIASLIR